jgi:hypothetical protein
MVREGKHGNLVAGKAGLETVQANPNHGMIISPTKEGANMETTLNAETLLSLPLEALQSTLLGVLSGNLKAKDGVLVTTEKSTGPRGPTAKVAPRLEACKATFLELAGRPEGVNAKELLTAGGEAFVYTDILLVARNLTEAGLIQESRKGRKATWNLTTSE